jgi:lipopolysaccharide export system protein LptC
MNTARWWRYGKDQLSAWLPALLMMLFALGTWWLVRSAPQLTGAERDRPVSAEPDYYMRDFSVRTFDPDGRLKTEIVGVEGHHFPVNDTLEISQPRIHSYDLEGHPTVATARRAVAKGDGSEVELFGDAHVVRAPITGAGGKATPQLEFLGEYLHSYVDEDRVTSDKPVELRRGADVFTGDDFAYDRRSGVADLKGRVHGVLQPARPAAGR